MNRFYVAVVATLLLVGGSHADIVYVDATTSNTTLADGTAMADGTVGYVANTGAADGLWNLRSGLGNGSSIFEAGASGSENAARLKTTMSGLTSGETYDVFGYFWAANNARWRGRLSLTDDVGDLPGYNTNHFVGSSFSPMSAVTGLITGDAGANPGPLTTATSGIVDAGYFTGAVVSEEADRRLYQISLGQVVAAGASIDVYVDDLVTGNQADRTWYDGVGHQLVVAPVPEPTSFAVLALGAMGCLVVRRR